MKIINASIDLTKIDKSKIVATDKNGNPFKNGAKYYNISIKVYDTPDQYGNDVSLIEPKTQEQRERQEKDVYLGNGKTVYDNARSMNQPSPEIEGENELAF